MYCRIDKIQSPDLIKDYVETRLRLAGGSKEIFTDEAIDILWEYSDHGVPRLINKFCKLCLKAGETNGFENIDGLTAKQMAERFQKLTRQAPQKRIPRKRLRDNSVEKDAEMETPDHEPLEPLNLKGDSFGLAEELPDCQPLEGIAATEENEVAPEAISEPVWEEAREPVHYEDAIVGKFKIKIGIPLHLLKLATSSTRENRASLAGRLAGQVLDRYPQLTSEAAIDAISLWSEMRSIILSAFEREIAHTEAKAIATAG
jgi:hypothetical protein